MKTRGSVKKIEADGAGALEADGGDDDDLLLDKLACAMQSRLIQVRKETEEADVFASPVKGLSIGLKVSEKGANANARTADLSAAGETATASPGAQMHQGHGAGGAYDEATDGFMALEDAGSTRWTEAEIEASIAKATWVPRTGLPLPASTPASRRSHAEEKGKGRQFAVGSKGGDLRGTQGSKLGESTGQLSGDRSGDGKGVELLKGKVSGKEVVGQGSKGKKASARVAGVLAKLEKQVLIPPKDHRKELRESQKHAKQSAGRKWFDLPAQTITPEIKQELRLIKLRGTLDPKRHYKAPDSTKFPKFFQMGTVVESAADFYAGRLTKKERKGSFAGELLADAKLKGYRKRKYTEIQAEKDLKSRRHYKKQQEKAKPSWQRT
eukprot:TRINITY_DN12683_c0_g1_i1.p1 TRINITY_DN12683_c0_g1~~TRINITY_DN12683_c0_g1_i1.p1  ORF type:complete len:382 (-),score=83.02 TRINITY_DN12683_c0_g1_i1:120-1265(-)